MVQCQQDGPLSLRLYVAKKIDQNFTRRALWTPKIYQDRLHIGHKVSWISLIVVLYL